MQSNLDQRIILYDASASTFVDLTIKLNEWNNLLTAPIIMDPGDYLYISTFLPFNHKYFKLSVISPTSEIPTMEVLNGPTDWSPVVDILDYTFGMTVSGVMQWTTDYDKGWGLISRSKVDVPSLSGGPMIYDSYWMRISFATQAVFTLEYIGQKFSSDADLYQEYPSLQSTSILTSWKTGKTTWDDQHLLAANYISKMLIQRNLIFTNNQILDIASLRSPSVHKAAHIIYSGLGARNYAEEIKMAEVNFDKAMTQDKFQVDTNSNARKDRSEVTMMTTSRASR